MVVMDDISENYESLFTFLKSNADYQSAEEHLEARNLLSDKVRARLVEFHQAGFVHGDLRDTNVMVRTLKRGGFKDGSFQIVDFDSSGRMDDEVRYPFTLNTHDIWRPPGATGGALIEAGHDMAMLDHIWD